MSFSHEIREAKLKSSITFPWNNEHILETLNFMDDLIDEKLDNLFMYPKRYANIGVGDGELAFYLESLGNECDIVDDRQNNLNALLGAERLRSTLRSSAKIFTQDLKKPLELTSNYDFVFLIDFISLLRDPFTSLENLAIRCKYLLVSTTVIKAASGELDLSSIPSAALLDGPYPDYGRKRYWAFNESGIERLANRTGWSIVGIKTLATPDILFCPEPTNQRRTIVLLKSKMGDEDFTEYETSKSSIRKNKFLSVRELFVFLSNTNQTENLRVEFFLVVQKYIANCVIPPIDLKVNDNSITVIYHKGETIHFDGEEWYHVRP